MKEEKDDEKDVGYEVDKLGRRKGGRPHGTTDMDVVRNSSYDKIFNTSLLNIRENRRMAKKLMKQAMMEIKNPVDFITVGGVISKFMEQVTHCDKLMVELAKLKREDKMNEQGGGVMTQETLFDSFEEDNESGGEDVTSPKL